MEESKNKRIEDQDNEFQKLVSRILKQGLPSIVFLLLLVYFSHILFDLPFLGTNADFAGFGDYIGGILNPVLSFFTVLILIKSVRFQVRELISTRKEIEETNKIHGANLKQQEMLFNANVYVEDINLLKQQAERLFDSPIVPLMINDKVSLHSIFKIPYSGYETPKLDQTHLKLVEEIYMDLTQFHQKMFFLMTDERTKEIDQSYYKFRLDLIEKDFRKALNNVLSWLNIIGLNQSVRRMNTTFNSSSHEPKDKEMSEAEIAKRIDERAKDLSRIFKEK